jgi:TRAP transporter TAXI family solute receptor
MPAARLARRQAILLAGAAAAMPLRPARAANLEWAAGSVGGSWFTIVSGLTNLVSEADPTLTFRVVPGGGRDNPSKVQAGISQVAMGIDFLAAAAFNGTEPYRSRHDKLRSIGGGWAPAQFHVFGPKDGPDDLRAILSQPRLRIGTTPRATSEELTLRRALAFYGSGEDRIRAGGGTFAPLEYAELVGAFADSRIDYVWGAASVPASMATEVSNGRRAAKLLAFPDDLQEHLQKTFGYGRDAIPAGSYPTLQSGPVSVTSLEAIILVGSDLAEDTAYRLTRALIAQRGRFAAIHAVLANFDPAKHWRNQPVPLHPGAERAYREGGFMS